MSYAHQGGANEAPSSTLHAIENAIRLGCNAIELDIHMTSDGVLVACHDPTLDRTTGTTGAIADHTYAQLAELDNAYWFVEGQDVQHDRDVSEYTLRGRAPADHGYGIATLDEIIDITEGIVLNLDIKKTAPDVPPYEIALADLLRRRRRVDDVIVASFLDSASAAFKAYAPDIATSAGTNAVAEFFRAVRAGAPVPEAVAEHVALQVPARFQDMVVVDQTFVEAAHHAGLAVHVWTINERDEMEQLCDLGVDGIISDAPSVMVDVLDARRLAWRGSPPA